MKKIISVLLSFTILLSISGFAYAEEKPEVTSDPVQTEKYKRYMDIAKAFGMTDDDFLDQKDENTEVTRNILAQLLCNIMQVNFSGSSWYSEIFAEDNANKIGTVSENESIFDDVDINDDYYKYIYIATTLGVMSKDGDSFYPDEEVTDIQAYKCLVYILGYRLVAERNGGYPNGILKTAQDLGLMKNVGGSVNSTLTLGKLAAMFYNMLEVNTVELSEMTENSISFDTKSGETFMKKAFGAYKLTGIMEESTVTTFTAKKSNYNERIKIDGISVLINDEQKIYNSYLGYKVTVYYCGDNDNNNLIYMEKSDNSGVVSLKGDDITDYSSGTLTASNKTYKIATGAFVIYNNVAINTYDRSNFVFDNGDITLFKLDNSNEYNLAVINNYKSRYVTAIDTKNEKINFAPLDGVFKESDSLDYSDDSTIFWFDSDREKADINVIKVGSVAEVAQNGDVASVIVTNNSVGEFTVNSVESEEQYTRLSSGEQSYLMENDYLVTGEKTVPKTGKNIMLYLNSRGNIVWYEAAAEVNNVGYLIKIWTDESLEDECSLKIFTSNGKISMYTVAEKANVTDESGQCTRTTSGKTVKKLLETYKGIIIYKYNDKKQIISIELPRTSGQDEDKLFNYSKIYGMPETCTSANRALYSARLDRIMFKTKGRTKILHIPTTDIEREYFVSDYDGTDNEFVNYREYTVTCYGTEPDYGIIDYILLYEDSQSSINWSRVISEKTNVFVVKNVQTCVVDGEVVDKITAYTGAGYNGNDEVVDLYCDSTTEASSGEQLSLFNCMNDFINSKDENEKIREYKAQKGDIIICSYNRNTMYVRGCKMIFKANSDDMYAPSSDRKGWLAGTEYTSVEAQKYKNPISFSTIGVNEEINNFYDATNRIFCGYVLGMNNSIIRSTVQDLSAFEYVSGMAELCDNWYIELATATTVTYDGKNDITMKKYSAGDIKSYEDYGSDCSRILVISREGGYCNLIIINGSI